MTFRTLMGAFLTLVTIVATVPSVRADLDFSTPAGLAPGQSFFVVFTDADFHSATSTNIADYNKFIQTDASGIHYAAGTISSWQVIGSTEASNAAQALFANTSTPVYSTSGSKLSDTGLTLLSAAILEDQAGGFPASPVTVFTGLNSDGTTFAGNALGDSFVGTGDFGEKLSGFGLSTGAQQGGADHLYGYATFTVGPLVSVPEPTTIPLVVGFAAFGVARWAHRRRRGTASGPSACARKATLERIQGQCG
jgi:hypothetical protein